MHSIARTGRRGLASLVQSTPAANTLGYTYRKALGNVPETKITKLSNGLFVATESNPNFQSAAVGLYINAGSRHETPETNGIAHFLEHVALKGGKGKSAVEFESQVEAIGGRLSAHTSREHTAFQLKCLSGDVSKAVELLSDVAQNPEISSAAVDSERQKILAEIADPNRSIEEIVYDHLHGCAFQSSPLGMTVAGKAEAVKALTREDLVAFKDANYTADRMVLVGSGNIEHDTLVKLAESHLKSLKTGPGAHVKKPVFVGSDVRARFDDQPTCHIAMAVQGAGVTSPDYFPLLVAQQIIGSWSVHLGAAPHTSSKLVKAIHKYKLAESFKAFNVAYSDTALFGIYVQSSAKYNLDDLTHYIQQEWHRLAINLTDAEVFRAKNQLRSAMLMGVEGTDGIAEDIGKQVLAYGKRMTPWEVDGLIEAVTTKDVTKAASKYIYDNELAVVGYGPVLSLQDYTRMRSAMSPIYY
ncbi:hypothetical protein HK101_010700 [Irineochytrium annulatum]|nr:hypothetical protein HK101_010700 [Irineochytrium annulatum]